jgi:hypothetical protein
VSHLHLEMAVVPLVPTLVIQTKMVVRVEQQVLLDHRVVAVVVVQLLSLRIQLELV